MTSKLTREQLLERTQRKVKRLAAAISQSVFTGVRVELEEEMQIAEYALSCLESEPALYCKAANEIDPESVSTSRAVVDAWVDEWNEGEDKPVYKTVALYTSPQPAPVMPFGLHPDTHKLVTDFCTALAEKLYKAQLKYGYDADWKQDGWPSQCQAHFHQHIAKGDPRDVAAYCAFMWYHGWKTETAQPAPVVPAVSDDISEIRVGRLPTVNQDDYPGLGDWWVQLRIGEDYDEVLARVYGATPQEANRRAEALSCRSALLNHIPDANKMTDHSPDAGNMEHFGDRAEKVNYPDIPEGWALVPKEATPEMLQAAWELHGIHHPSAYRTMIAAAPKPEE